VKLKALELSDFRGFAGVHLFDLDANAIIVVGTNGNGKTSLFDAVLWALSGRIPRLRLGDKDSELVCKYSKTGQARVVLTLGGASGGKDTVVTRTFDGEKTNVRIESADGAFDGPRAEGQLIELVWKDAATSADPGGALASVLTRCLYLQQDLVRQFIESETEQDRFTAVSELMGAGRITELQVELEKQKANWTRASTARQTELQPMRSRLSAIDARVMELKARPADQSTPTEDEWSVWWRSLEQLGLRVTRPAMDSREAPSNLDAAIKNLDGLKRAAQRREHSLASLLGDVDTLGAPPDMDTAAIREQVAALTQRRDAARVAVGAEQVRMAELRRAQSELRERSEQLRVLASLALQHLGESCPVCQQKYDLPSTRRRLQSLASGPAPAGESSTPDMLPQLAQELAASEKALSDAALQLRSREQADRDRSAAEAAVVGRIEALSLSATAEARRDVVAGALAETRRQVELIASAQTTGESLALRLSRAGEQAALVELEREGAEIRSRLRGEDEELTRRGTSGELAQRVIEALREATSETVKQRIHEIEPLLGEVYSRIDVHPAFRVVKFLAEVVGKRGRLSTIVSDPVVSVETDVPAQVLSSSQMNALAVCTFLSLNLGMAHPPIEAAILDDPLQSLDDINLLGLIDLLRRTKDQRQLCCARAPRNSEPL